MECKILRFENSLCLEAISFLNNSNINRQKRPDQIKLPFLKLNVKILKMNSNDLKNKDVTKMKFRPVQDSSSWILKPYAIILMELLRDLMSAVKRKYIRIKHIDSLNGANVSKEMRHMEFSEEILRFFVSSDMSSAYSNIYKKDVFRAITIITKLLGVTDWRRDILLKLTELILSSNYIETSVGTFIMGDCLPMGSSASQDCLNVVAMVHELELFEGVCDESESEAKVDEHFTIKIMEGPKTNRKDCLTQKQNDSIKLFKRYIDDTHEVISSDVVTDAKESIIKILTMYPENLDMNTVLGLKYFSHLDCSGYLKFRNNSMTTFVRRNYTAPVNLVPKVSNCPDSNKYSILLSEMLRYRRLCSNQKLVDMNEKQLFTELYKAGYCTKEIKILSKKNRKLIKENFTDDYFTKKLSNNKNIEESVYSKVTFDKLSSGQNIINQLVKGGGRSKIKTVIVPSLKIKTFLISRKRHLKTLRNFINNKTI